VRLTTEQAPQVYAAACALWSRNAASASATPAATPGAGATNPEAQSAVDCQGRDGAIRYKGRLGEEADRAEMAPTETTLSITLDSAPGA